MKKLGIPMVLLCAVLLLLAPQAASAKSHWSFYAGVTPSYSYIQAYPNYYYTSPYSSPYYYYPSYSPYYYMYPRHEWSFYYNRRGHEWREHGRYRR